MKTVSENTEKTALDRLQDVYRTTREKVKEANSALTEFAGVLREAVREDKQHRNEVAQVRAGLEKLKSLHV